jgi:hypothetical protein
MPTARTALAAVTATDGRIYAIGGSPDPYGITAPNPRSLGTAEAYDPRTNTWSKLPGLNVPRFLLAAVMGRDGYIYAVGGSASSAVERFKVPVTPALTPNSSATPTLIPAASPTPAILRSATATLPATPARTPTVAPTAPGTTSLVCTGPYDLLVDGRLQSRRVVGVRGSANYDHVCVIHGGALRTNYLIIQAHFIYVDASSSISGDGRNGGTEEHGCPFTGNGRPDADPGALLRLEAPLIEIDGEVTANGGQGLSSRVATATCQSNFRAGRGGDGGSVTIAAGILRLKGTIAARGGDGGTGNAYGTVGGDGGSGGTVTLESGNQQPASVRGRLDVRAGGGGVGKTAQNQGRNGQMGQIAITGLGAAQPASATPTATATLPATPSVTPTALPSLSSIGGLTCTGSHDLRVDGRTLFLTGSHTFNRICILHGGTVSGSPLDLEAGSIYVDAQSSIHADGRNGSFQGNGCPPDGLGDPNDDANWSQGVTLGAMVIEIDGQVTANGGLGLSSRAATGSCPRNFRAVSGGHGGILDVVTGALRLQGTLSARGGDGGSGKAYWNLGGKGGNGGSILIETLYPLPASARALLHVEGGMGGVGATPQDHGLNGHMGDVSWLGLSLDNFSRLPQPLP